MLRYRRKQFQVSGCFSLMDRALILKSFPYTTLSFPTHSAMIVLFVLVANFAITAFGVSMGY